MVKHIVFWKVKDNDDKQKNIDRMIEMLTSLVGKVEGLVSVEMGYNFNTSSDYDVVLYATLKNPAALKYYQNHPEHVKCKEFISQVTVDRTVADYFFEEETTASKPVSEVADVPTEQTKVSQPSASYTEIKEEPVLTAPTAEEPKKAPEIVVEKTEPKPAPKTKITIEKSEPTVSEPVQPVFEQPVSEKPAEEPKNDFGFIVHNGNASNAGLPDIEQEKQPAMSYEELQQFEDVQPSVQGYNPQIKAEEQLDENNGTSNADYQAPDLSFIKAQGTEFEKPEKLSDNLNAQADTNYAQPLEPINFEDAPPPAPMRFNADSSSYNFGGEEKSAPKPMKFSDMPVSSPTSSNIPPAPAPKKTPQNAQVNPVSTEHSKIKETTSMFGKKKIDVEVTPLEQRGDTWTCPNCGKIMPKYVGTCGCGEVQPFDFGDDTPAPAPSAPAPMTFDRTPKTSAPAPQKTPQNAQVNPVSTEHSKIKETTSMFGKKKIDVEVTPLEQRGDTWTCPNCGKIMPKYVGTCGCGEVQPFDFGDSTPAPAPMTFDRTPKTSAPAPMTFDRTPITSSPAQKTPQNAQVNPVSTEHSKIKESTSMFGKKKIDVEVTPLEQRGDTWTCPNCGKIMPKYVGTCGCGEPQPFDFG